jgi:hypothetical protein
MMNRMMASDVAARSTGDRSSAQDRASHTFARSPSAPVRQVRQDKLVESLNAQTRRYPLQLLAFRHVDRQSDRILHGSSGSAQTQRGRSLAADLSDPETRNHLQITRYYDSMSRDKLFESEGDPQPRVPPF